MAAGRLTAGPSALSLNDLLYQALANASDGKPGLVVTNPDGSNINGSGATSTQVQGAGAAGSAVVGNPVLIAGSDGTNTRTMLTDAAGNHRVIGTATGSAVPGSALFVGLQNASGNLVGWTTASAQGDGSAGGSIAAVSGMVFNGTTYDRLRSGPTTGSVLVSAPTATGAAVPANAFFMGMQGSSSNLQSLRSAGNLGTNGVGADFFLGVGEYNYNGTNFDARRTNFDTGALITASGATTTQTTADQVNYNGRGIKVVLDMTVVGTGSVTLEIDGKDTASGKYYAILTGAAVVTNSTNVYTIFPGATAAANATANDVLPRTWRIKVTANNANATTYTVGASVLV